MFLKVKEAAAILNCSADSIYQLISDGRLQAVNIARNPSRTRAAFRIPEKAIERLAGEPLMRRF